MGVWIGALLSYATVLAPRVSRLFILASAAAGIGQLADDVFEVLYELRTRGLSSEAPRLQPVSGKPAAEETCPACGAPTGARPESAQAA